MSARSAARAASGAQRSGAAALIIQHYARDAQYCRDRSLYFASSFFVPRAPTRWGAGSIVRASLPAAHGAGGAVLWFYTGQGGRTGKPLETCGSVVLFCGGSPHACAGAGVRVCAEDRQNHRTTEPCSRNEGNLPFLEGEVVLSRFCGSGPNIIGGGYADRARQLADGPDLRLIAGGAWRNFWGSRAVSGLAIGLVAAGVGNGGFPPFSGVLLGPVGMVSSEWIGKSDAGQALSGVERQTAQLHARPLATPPGSIAQGEGGTPPTPAATFHCTLALPVFPISIDLPIAGQPEDAAKAVTSGREKGSGVARLPASVRGARQGGHAGRVVRVRDGELSVCGRGNREATNMRVGGDHVNA